VKTKLLEQIFFWSEYFMVCVVQWFLSITVQNLIHFVAHNKNCVYVKLKDRKRSLSRKNDHNTLWHYRNSHNAKFRVVAVFKQPRGGLG
jgi:hypothetical protein